MTEEIILFEDNNVSIEERFYFFMDLLVSNKSGTRIEQICLFLIFYIQIISVFFDTRIKVFNPDENLSDKILLYFYKVFRIVGIISNHKSYYVKIIYIIPIFMLFLTLFAFFVFYKTKKNSLYHFIHFLLNLLLKCVIFIFYNISLDFFTHLICFKSKYNDYIKGYSCSIQDNKFTFIISLITTIYIVFVIIFILHFYNDSFYLSMNYYAQTCTYYNIYLVLNCILLSLMFSIINHLTIEVFLFTNLIISISFLIYFIKKIIYYERITNLICGIFHIIYIWTTLFCLIFKYVDVSEKGLVWLITSIILSFTFLNFKKYFDNVLFYNKPYYTIKNIDHLLYYFRKLVYMINYDSQDTELKSTLTGIIQLHVIECPNKNCIVKKKEQLFLPKTEKWSDRTKPFILDDVFLSHFLIDVNDYFLSINLFNPEFLINLSYYYLNFIGNIIQSIYFFHKVKKMKLTIQEKFFLKRLEIAISRKLIEKLKYENEICENLDELNPSHYYSYEYYKEQFYSLIFKDLELLKKFWGKFSHRENKSFIDYNEVFKLTEKIMICKIEIENLWKKLFSIYSGMNEVFDFYIDYVEQINDDSFLKINLESIKRKTENSTEHIHQNFYNMMFNKETGIIICNGDYGKEGLIEKVNHSFEKIFKFTFDEMRGMNISLLMPKIFEKEHHKFMKEYIKVGKKYLLNYKGHHTFGKDKNNSIILIKINLKIFPVLNQSVYFLAMIIPEKVDDLIFIDSNFIIQGMSKKLTEKFQISNKYFFMNYNIPFYMICKNFIHFYKTFMKENKEDKENNSLDLNLSQQELDIDSSNEIKKKDINIEINENIELEYEIKIPSFILKYEKISKKENLYHYFSDIEGNIEFNHRNSSIENDTSNNGITSTTIVNEEITSLIQSPVFPIIKKRGSAHLINNNFQTPFSTPKLFEKFTPHNDTVNSTIKNEVNYGNKGSQIQINNEELIFLNKLKVYKNLFVNGHFSKLEEIIDSDTKEECITFKFNFTFKKYNYNQNKVCFIIRCVDNKNEHGLGYSSSVSEGLNFGVKIISDKDKLTSLQTMYKIGEIEKKNIEENITEFGNYFFIDNQMQKMFKVYKDYMKKFSRIHGKKKHNSVMDDENSSQTAATSYNSDLSKINRIFEMKENVLTKKKKISYIYNLIFIMILLVLGSSVFSAVFFRIVKKIHSGLKLITLLNSNIFFINLRITGTTSIIISLKTLYNFYFDDNLKNNTMNTFIDEHLYFKLLQEKAINWISESYEMINNFEGNITHAANKYNVDLWNQIPENYIVAFPEDDSESYIQTLMNTLTISQSFLTLKFFNLNNNTLTNNDKLEFRYISFGAIENPVDFAIPNGLEKVPDIMGLLIKYNNEKINNVYLSMIVFIIFIFILEIIYIIILYRTNKYIAFGFLKIEKISQENIEIMIQKIKNFSEHYKKRNEILLSMNDNFFEQNNTVINSNQPSQTLSQNNQLRKVNSDFSLEMKKHKQLIILNTNYIHFPLIFFVCVVVNFLLYYISQSAIKSNASMIKIQTYLFGKFLSVSCSTVNIKCILAQCNVNNTLDCDSFLDEELSYTLYHSFNKFPTLDIFYNEYFLKDACAAIFDLEDERYENCLKNSMVKLINNTNSFLDYVKECINNLLGEHQNNLLQNPSYSSFDLFASDTYRKMEEGFFNYIVPVVKKMNNIIIDALNNFVKNEYNIAISVISVFLVVIVAFFFFVIMVFIKKLEYSIKISKNIFRITPSIIISSNQDLENWLESINNES